MSKTLIFFADGTWNGPGEQDDADMPYSLGDGPSNVRRLYLSLEGQDHDWRMKESERRTDDGLQIARYINGVGDTKNFFGKFFQGATGWGVVTRIIRGYTFISRNYCAGDKIILIGFSRGAYTARALAGLIAACGLMDAEKNNLDADRDGAYARAAKVWYQYRRKKVAASAFQSFTNWWASFLGPFAVDTDPAMISDVTIDTVAVWDTVGALGIPIYLSQEYPPDFFQFADLDLSPKVTTGFHLVSVDEQRTVFSPTLWNARGGVVQALMPGGHADVGGGYAVGEDSGLSDSALGAMIRLLGARIRLQETFPVKFNPDPLGVGHQAMSAGWRQVTTFAARQEINHLSPSTALIDRLKGSPVEAIKGEAKKYYRPTNIDIDYMLSHSPVA